MGGTVTETAQCIFSNNTWSFSGLTCSPVCSSNYLYSGVSVKHIYSSDHKTVTSTYTITYTDNSTYISTTVTESQTFKTSGSYVY